MVKDDLEYSEGLENSLLFSFSEELEEVRDQGRPLLLAGDTLVLDVIKTRGYITDEILKLSCQLCGVASVKRKEHFVLELGSGLSVEFNEETWFVLSVNHVLFQKDHCVHSHCNSDLCILDDLDQDSDHL